MNEEMQAGRSAGVKSEMSGRFTGSGGGSGRGGWIAAVVVVVVVVVLGIIFRENIFGGSSDSADKAETGMVGEYQAVFLSNGQVYFGKLEDVSSDYATLSDIYYLQVTASPPLQGPADQQPAQQNPQLQLVKLGNELHGPEDKMHINTDHILFFEDIKDSGRVVQAIKEYQANPNRGSQSGTQQQPAQQAPATQQAPAQQQAPAGN